MSYMLSDLVETCEGHILANCESCSEDIVVSLLEFKRTWKDADESTKVLWICKKCAINLRMKN